ncbi:MAG: hypothetical protein CVT83_02445 [Alphaproteobacteria bacterium HGW-Alphaproteobacteria-5]|jgi:iron complex outermembrane receptor protein|nr:MAG: hypothetical protein CVT83_02445 [Alphaproteobacteria bacterium HGW-Alphaproteobacteria-5]
MRNLHVGVAAVALLWAGQASAQDMSGQPGNGVDAPADVADGEIIVTAQKRSERLVDVPVSITAVSSDSLSRAGLDSLISLNKLVPGLYINQPSYFLSPTIRGVGSTLAVSNEGAVALYVDGVYQPAQASTVFDLASVSGVEVLKGPQGTLFGRNATGGAILVKTLDPGFQPEVKANVSIGRFTELRMSGYANLPVSDTIAANVAASYKHSDGFIRDVRTNRLVNESKSFAVRGKVLFAPSDDIELILTASHTQYSDPTPQMFRSLHGENALSGRPGAGPLATDIFHTSHNVAGMLKNRSQEYTSHLNIDTGLGTLSSITALKRDKLSTSQEGDATYLPVLSASFNFYNRTFTQEVNLTSPSGSPFSYVVGAYYFHNRKYYDPFQYNGIDFLTQEQWTDALAGYADGTYQLGDLAVIAGIRYSTEKRKIDNGLLPHPLNAVTGTVHRETRESAWTPRFGLRYALGARSNIYATFSRGFKSGAFNGTSITLPGVTPETIDAYELGYKAAGPNFTFSAASYLYDYRDLQVNTLTITDGVALNNTTNAAKARIYGFELEGSYQPTDALGLRVGVGYTHAKYTSFRNAPGYEALGGGAYASESVDATNNHMVRQPRFQISGEANYKLPVGNKDLTFTVSPSYNSMVYFDFANQLSQKGVFLLDGSVELDLRNGVKLAVFGRNITDTRYFTSQAFSTFHISTLYGAPATYGISASYAFK